MGKPEASRTEEVAMRGSKPQQRREKDRGRKRQSQAPSSVTVRKKKTKQTAREVSITPVG